MWLDNYLNLLSQQERQRVTQTVGQKTFKFGGGGEFLESKKEYDIPAVIAKKHVTTRTDVVYSDISLLFSRQAMTTAGIKMDLRL